MKKIVLAVGGSSGSIYAKVLMDKLVQLQAQLAAVGVVMSENARYNWELELGNRDYESYPFTFYDKKDFMAPFASGSAKYDTFIACPCSMGLMGRIASGVSDDLVTRAADVILKERRRLILVIRDTPYNLIHINNMKLLTEAGQPLVLQQSANDGSARCHGGGSGAGFGGVGVGFLSVGGGGFEDLRTPLAIYGTGWVGQVLSAGQSRQGATLAVAQTLNEPPIA